MYPITITIHNDEQFGAVRAALGGRAIPTPEKPSVKKPQPAPSQVASAPSAASPASTGQGPAAAPSISELTYEHVKGPFLAYANAKGREAAVDLLAEFGVPSGGTLSKVAPEHYPRLLEVIGQRSLG